MSTCPECGGIGWITLLTSKAKCAHPSHGAIEHASYVEHVNSTTLSAGKYAPTQTAYAPMLPDQVVSGPGYYARCSGERLCSTPFRTAARVLLVVEGSFESDDFLMGANVELSKYMPLRGNAIVIESLKSGIDAPTVHRFRSNGPILKPVP